jgi:membrane associated rhomboid family serine protease
VIDTDPNLPVRLSREKRKADEWSLVLTSADIEHDVRPEGRDWVVLVGDDDLAAALTALDAYDYEQRQAAESPPPVLEYGRSHAAIGYFAALISFFIWVEYLARTYVWEDAGRAYSTRIRDGEWWRAVTALTLHTDFVHVLGNAVVGGVFGGALCRAIGPGAALWVMLIAGGGGNLINALIRNVPHAAVGASTAVFGAFGALAGLQAMHRYRFISSRRKAWLPAAAALAMLAMLGVGENSDIWAHFLGLLVGFVAGLLVGEVMRRPPTPTTEYPLIAAGLAAVIFCWLLAFS